MKSSSGVEIGLLEGSIFRDDAYLTFVRVGWTDDPRGLDDLFTTTDPFFDQEVIARTRVETWDDAIELLARIKTAFAEKFARFDGSLRFETSSERDRSEMVELFKRTIRRRRGRPRGGRHDMAEQERARFDKNELDFSTIREFVRAKFALKALSRSKKTPDQLADSAADFFQRQTVTPIDVERWLSQADAQALRACWLFQRFKRCQSTAYCDFGLFLELWKIEARLERLWDGRREVGAFQMLQQTREYVPISAAPIVPSTEIQRLLTAIKVVEDEDLARSLVARLSPSSQQALHTAVREFPSLDELLEGKIEFRPLNLKEIEAACCQLILQLKRKPKSDTARETVRLIKRLWRKLAGPDAKCIVYPRKAHLSPGEKSRPYGDCVDLIRDISEHFDVDLPVDALKGAN